MLKIIEVSSDSKLKFSTNKQINDLYLNCRCNPESQCFHFIDDHDQLKGFYGIAFDHEVIDKTYHLMIDVLGLYVDPDVKPDDYLDPFIDHLFNLLLPVILDAQMQNHPKLAFDVISEHESLANLVRDVANAVMEELNEQLPV